MTSRVDQEAIQCRRTPSAAAAELLAKLSRMGMRVEEVPVRLDWTRRAGKSKMPIAATVFGYWRMLLRARAAGEPASG